MKTSLPHYLRQWRHVKDVKQQWLARQLGITPSALSKIENYQSCLDVNRARMIAGLLQIEVSAIFEQPYVLVDLVS